jgi:Uma2 family endonuclease
MALPATQHPPSSQIRALTYEDLQAIPEDGNRYELINGEIVMSPAPKTIHQRILRKLTTAIDRVINDGAIGETFFAPIDVKFSTYNVFQPDLIFVRAERSDIVREDFVDGAPDFVVEVLSPSNRAQDLVRKAAVYADFGISEYWVIDPDAKPIIVNLLEEGRFRRTSIESGSLRSAVIPGLEINLSELLG